MENKPKIYGYCPAGCKWETVHKEDFDKSATWIRQYADESGVYELEPLNKYKIYSPVSAGAYSCVVSLVDADEPINTHTFAITEFDEYRNYFYFEILYIGLSTEPPMVVYEINGTRHSGTIRNIDPRTSGTILTIIGATDVLRFNDDASITVNVTDAVNQAITTALNTEV